jgi:hypothetical protein
MIVENINSSLAFGISPAPMLRSNYVAQYNE